MPHRDPLDGRIGEGWAGEAPNGSHINVVLTRRGSSSHAAVVAALANPRPGHVPFLPVLRLGEVVRPVAIVVNKSTIPAEGELGRLTWGAAQLGIAQGILDCVADGTIPAEQADDMALLVAVWVDPAAHDERGLKQANRDACAAAIRNAVHHVTADEVRALADRREEATSAYYRGG